MGLCIPEPAPADYHEELTATDLAALRESCTQDAAAMGTVVHEFRW